MNKLKLNLEDLKVKSFVTSSAFGESGTVYGQTDLTAVDCSTDNPNDCGGTITNYGSCNACNGSVNVCSGGDDTCMNCTAYGTCWCANNSAEGYASCGTTCMEPSCQLQCGGTF